MDNQVTIIEITADYLYLIILGDKSTIDDLVNDIKVSNPTDSTKYISVKIDNPAANKSFELTNVLNKDVIVADGVETAQCYTFAEGYNNQSYMLMTVQEDNNTYVLGYPKFNLDEEDPEIIIENWFKKKIKNIPNGIKKNMKSITVVGIETNILVMATKIKKKKQKN